MKIISKILSLVIMTGLLVSSFTACGGKETPSENSREISSESYKISGAFAEKSIWFLTHQNESPAKDTKIRAVFVFDGKGNFTIYDVTSDTFGSNDTFISNSDYEPLCFGDLRDLSDEEILELVKEKNRTWFEATKQYAIKLADGEAESYYGDSTELNTIRDKWEQLEYESQIFQQPVRLEITTDDTGNQTAEERLCYISTPARALDSSDASILPPFDEESRSNIIKLYPTNSSYIVYDKTFMGCGNLYQIREEGEFGWGFDTPDTEGIKVD